METHVRIFSFAFRRFVVLENLNSTINRLTISFDSYVETTLTIAAGSDWNSCGHFNFANSLFLRIWMELPSLKRHSHPNRTQYQPPESQLGGSLSSFNHEEITQICKQNYRLILSNPFIRPPTAPLNSFCNSPNFLGVTSGAFRSFNERSVSIKAYGIDWVCSVPYRTISRQLKLSGRSNERTNFEHF